MMRHVIFLALVGASFAANNVLQCTSGCDWYTSASSWSLSRFPRTGDSSIVNADTKFADNAPAYMVGASQGAELRVGGGATLEIAGDAEIVFGAQKNAPENCIVGQFSAWGACTKKCGTGSQSR